MAAYRGKRGGPAREREANEKRERLRGGGGRARRVRGVEHTLH